MVGVPLSRLVFLGPRGGSTATFGVLRISTVTGLDALGSPGTIDTTRSDAQFIPNTERSGRAEPV